MYWCFCCYGLNREPHGRCVHCGGAIEHPPGLSYNDQLVWALGHPDGDRAALAAQTLGRRRICSALPALRKTVQEGHDPYVAAAALRSAVQIAGSDELRPWLEQLAGCDSFMIRAVAQRSLVQRT